MLSEGQSRHYLENTNRYHFMKWSHLTSCSGSFWYEFSILDRLTCTLWMCLTRFLETPANTMWIPVIKKCYCRNECCKRPPKETRNISICSFIHGFRFLQIRIQNDGEYDKIDDNYWNYRCNEQGLVLIIHWKR